MSSTPEQIPDTPAPSDAGQELEPLTRSLFEPLFGTGFGDVRIHTGTAATRAAHQAAAKAFTVRSDITFGAGNYVPHTSGGRRLLAHELAHVVQARHTGGPPQLRRQAKSVVSTASAQANAVPTSPGLGQVAGFADYDKGPLRAQSKSYFFRGVEMSTDADYMRRQLKLLVRRFGIKGGDLWFDALEGRDFDLALPFSAHATAFGGLRPRTAMDANRDLQNDAVRDEIGGAAKALAELIFPQVRAEAVAIRAAFVPAMRKVLEVILVESERRLETQRVLLGIERTAPGPFGSFEAQDTVAFRGLVGAATDLLTIRKSIDRLLVTRRVLLRPMPRGGLVLPEENRPRYEQLTKEVAGVEDGYAKARQSAAGRYPALGAILDDAGGGYTALLEALAGGERKSSLRPAMFGRTGTAGALGLILESRQSSIDTVRSKVDKDPERLWSLSSIVALTRAEVGTQNNIMADKIIDEKLADLAFDESIRTMFMGLIAFALLIPSGGTSAVVIGGARLALSGYQMLKSLEKYEFESALSSTDLDRRAHAISAEEPSFFWVAADVVFFVADGAGALKAVRELRPIAREALLAKEGADFIAASGKLEKAADAVGTAKPGLGKRLLGTLKSMRRRPTGARLLGDVGEAEAKAVIRSTEAIAKEAEGVQTIATVAGHDIKATRSGALVVCSNCTWLRERYAREVAESPVLADRLIQAERKAASGSLDAAVRSDISALSRELEEARNARLISELGPLGAKAAAAGDFRVGFRTVLERRPGLSRELSAIEQEIASAGAIDPSLAARIDTMQSRLARLHEADALSLAPKNARLVEVSLDRTAANFYEKAAETVPGPPAVIEFPDGTRVWRDSVGGPIRHEARMGGSLGRADMETGFYTATEHGGLPPGPQYQRAHSLGQGTGFESPYALYYAPEYVNQALQNRGIETYMRDLAASQRPGETFMVLTETAAHPGTRRLSSISYRIQSVVGGKTQDIATYTIRVSSSAEHPVVTAGALVFAQNSTAAATATRVARPPVLAAAASHAY
ncbi:eCIS core domain-containing protein [Arthrobacter sp. H14-L1]|uniref:eCIS core domain-containing protein n=1 Tax=Arthrobacter sp. H14-L1 TaxID=2996697 RepID=UPI00226FA370|nr:DUF4157 domain-containing protein [Arthrobacter sp. H14-L1]MCY0906006.1 DUF4157 domain-containing protein [Arthrobacter sp. H14-L1]